jgi:phospholipid-translocating ATPase
MKGLYGTWYLQWFRFLLLLSSVIPISLKVNLDVTKLFFSWRINTDSQIENTRAQNTSIPEDLGRVEIILSDKTGT